MKFDNRPIGVFDSGVGGLTVAKEIKRLLPNEHIIYFGDTKHLPYGDKSAKTIQTYSKRITDFLLYQQCKAIVIACNSASSNARLKVEEIAKNKALVFDVIQPVAEKVAFEFHQKIGIIATKATVQSGVYKKQIRKRNKHIQVIEMATPLFVPIIEEGLLKSDISKATVSHYLNQRKLNDIDAIILGCTHYPLIEKEIKDFYNNRIKIINSPLIVVNQLVYKLRKEGLLANNQLAEYTFYLSDRTKNFEQLAKRIFGNQITLEQKQIHSSNLIES